MMEMWYNDVKVVGEGKQIECECANVEEGKS